METEKEGYRVTEGASREMRLHESVVPAKCVPQTPTAILANGLCKAERFEKKRDSKT